MKKQLALLTILAIFVFAFAPTANSAALEPFGKIELSGGGEKEAHTPSGGRFWLEGLGVLPLSGNWGVQGSMHYVTGLGSRIGFNVGPVIAWDGGKVGGFVAYQHRGLRGTDFVHLIPSVAFYLPQANLNLWYSQPVSGATRGGHRTEYGINKLQATASFFAGSDWFGPYLKKDNVELLGGLQVNTFAGAGHNRLDGTGFGGVLGASFLPMPGVTVNLIRASFDHQGRYKVSTGLEFFVDPKGSTSLKEERRKYLEPNQDGSQSGGKVKPSSHCRECQVSDRNAKTNIERVDAREILSRLAEIPVQKWNYKADDASIRHIGPMAQDFHAAFNVGGSDKMINLLDSNGVALASIQALYQMVQEKDQKIASLESRLANLEAGKPAQTQGPLARGFATGWPLIALVAAGGFFVARKRKDN